MLDSQTPKFTRPPREEAVEEVPKSSILEELKNAMKSYENLKDSPVKQAEINTDTANFSINSYLHQNKQIRIDDAMIDYLDNEIRNTEQSLLEAN